MPLAESTRRIDLTMVVLPTPGPPVMTSTLDISARRIAVFWLSASCRPVRCSTQGRALSGSIHGQGSLPFTSRISRSAMARSARYRPARNTHGVSPTLSAMTVPSDSSRSRAVRISSCGTSSNSSASGINSSVGKPQWPSSIASVRAKEMPARTRIMAVFSMPSFMAMASAVLKPMPRMSRASR